MFTSEIIQLCRALARCGGLLALPRRTIVPLVSLLLAMPSAAPSDDFWKHKPSRQWSAREALKLVRRSPWAKLETNLSRYRLDEANEALADVREGRVLKALIEPK